MGKMNNRPAIAVPQHVAEQMNAPPEVVRMHHDPEAFENDVRDGLLGDLVLLRFHVCPEMQKSAGGLILAGGDSGPIQIGKPNRAQIVAVGPGRIDPESSRESPRLVPMDERLKIDAVCYPLIGAKTEFIIGDELYWITNAGSILMFSKAPPQSLAQAKKLRQEAKAAALAARK